MVPEEAVYDLMVNINNIQAGNLKEPRLFGRAEGKSKTKDINT